MSGAASFNPGTASFFFLIAGKEGSLEGAYGRGVAGVERPGDAHVSPCTVQKSASSTCE